jgi:hypothetical protein
MIAALAFFVLQGVISVVASGQRMSKGSAMTLSFVLAGALIAAFYLLTYRRTPAFLSVPEGSKKASVSAALGFGLMGGGIAGGFGLLFIFAMERVPFLQQLDWHARKRVVIEMPMLHPMSRLSPMWKHFWNLDRPTAPNAHDLVSIAQTLGFAAQIKVWADAVSWGSRNVKSDEQRLTLARRRLCLGLDRTEELAAYLADHPETPVEIATVWWDVSR